MRRIALVAILLSGCQNQGTPLANPFLAPNRVPPPATRTPSPGTAVPYYSQGASQQLVRPGFAQADSPANTNAAPQIATSNGDGGSIRVPADGQSERFTRIATTSSNARSQQIQQARRSELRRQGAVEIGDLPPAQRRTARSAAHAENENVAGNPLRDERAEDGLRWARTDENDSSAANEYAVRTASFEQPAQRTRSVARSRYRYSQDYSHLQGQLEYSAATKNWKIRYIPIDGETDEFGGSVVVLNPQALGGRGFCDGSRECAGRRTHRRRLCAALSRGGCTPGSGLTGPVTSANRKRVRRTTGGSNHSLARRLIWRCRRFQRLPQPPLCQ